MAMRPQASAEDRDARVRASRFSSWWKFERPLDHWLSFCALALGGAAIVALLVLA